MFNKRLSIKAVQSVLINQMIKFIKLIHFILLEHQINERRETNVRTSLFTIQ